MLNYEEMQYFASFAETGTLSRVAEQFHISQPTITRAMKKAENEFGVPLFDRTKNSISLNDNGVYAAQEISILLKQTDETLRRVRAYVGANRTISSYTREESVLIVSPIRKSSFVTKPMIYPG